VHLPTIVDEESILALVEYETPYRSHNSYKTRIGLCNVVSGSVVMLTDGRRLHERDHQIAAGISPKGDAIAYRVCSGEGLPRLTIQPITVMPMRVKGVSVRVGSAPSWATETRKSREDLMLPDRFSIDGTVVQ